MTEREKIVQVLTHAVEQGSRSKYFGVRFYKVHEATVKEFEKELRKEIKIKIELFKKVDDKSNTYKIILSTAKLSLERLRKGDFEKTSSELINLFLSLQSVFRNKLEFVECKEYDNTNSIIDIPNKEETPEEKTKRLKILKRKIREIKYIPEGVTAKKKKKKEEKDAEKLESFQDANNLIL